MKIQPQLTKEAYEYVENLLHDGFERNLTFMQGLTTGVQLAALEKDKLKEIIEVLKNGAKKKGKKLFSDKDLEDIEILLKNTFNLNARKRITGTLGRASRLMIKELTEMLSKIISFL